MNWTECTGKVTLPTSDDNTSFQISASEDYCAIWNNGPKSHSSKDICAAIKTLAIEWGKLIKEFQGKTKVDSKNGPNDLVTEMDIGIEDLFRAWMAKWLPKHKIIGEEGPKDTLKYNDYIWYIDPIDGTNNYANNKKDVTVHIACIHNHHPFLAFVGLPIYEQWICGFNDKDETKIEQSPQFNWTKKCGSLSLCTEYLERQLEEETRFNEIAEKLDAEKVRYRAIGASVLHLLKNNGAFYKPAAKLWDVIPPMAILYFDNPYKWDFSVTYFPSPEDTEPVEQSLFATTLSFIHFLNSQHKESCRTGLVTATPLNNDKWKSIIKSIARIK